MKRQLNDKEKSVVKKNIEFLEEDSKYIEAMVKRVNVNLETAPIIYQRQFKVMEAEKLQHVAHLEEHQKSIKILNQQLTEGVEVDEKKQVKGGKKDE